MISKELNLKLIEFLPEIKELYEEEVSWQEGDETGSHIVFSDVFVPYILKNFDNAEITKKNFKVIEDILNLHDEYADEVIALSVLENLFYEENIIDKVNEHLGLLSRKAFEQFKA
ncbi:MAG: hypothetical protein IJO09_00810 [Oscillospiraceae bacterium]|nr:hypothetical protein [Oscillospiraceae bacterium]